MDEILALFRGIADDPLLLTALMGLTGAGLLGLIAASVLQGRSEIRRRASEGFQPEGRGDRRAQANQSLERLMGYLETTFANRDERETKALRMQLTRAGFFSQRAPAVYFAARFALALLLGTLALVALPFLIGEGSSAKLWLYAGGCAVLGYLAPSFYLSRRIAARTDQHRMGFPDFMDLMVVCAEAGLSMEASIDRVARELVDSYPSLAENLYMVSLEMRAGKAFGDALERMGQRVGIEEASMLASLLQQSAELGTSLSASLRVYSDEMRHKRLSRAEEKAYSLPAKLVVPLTLFVFPVLLVVLMTPVVIRMSGAFPT